MRLKRGMFFLSIVAAIAYFLYKRKYPEAHSNNYVLEIVASIVLAIGIFIAFSSESQTKEKFANIINIVIGLPMLVYIVVVLRQQVFLIDKINFFLIFILFSVSVFQSVSLLRRRHKINP
jgi:hypothetical protein